MTEYEDVEINLKQSLNIEDYFGFVAVWIIFFAVVFVISFTCLNWLCVQKTDDITVFEKWGANRQMKMGPHRLSVVQRQSQKVLLEKP